MKRFRARRLRGAWWLGLWGFTLSACILFPEDGKTARAGGGSDTETLTGLVASHDGRPAARVAVKLIPADFDPSRSDPALIRRAVTDDSGLFRFDKLDTAAQYNVIAGNGAEKAWAFLANLKSGPGRNPLRLSLAKVFLFTLHSSAYAARDSGIAYFPGTDILAHCDGVTASKVDSVPAGALRFIVASKAGWIHDTTLVSAPDTVAVSADKSSLILSP